MEVQDELKITEPPTNREMAGHYTARCINDYARAIHARGLDSSATLTTMTAAVPFGSVHWRQIFNVIDGASVLVPPEPASGCFLRNMRFWRKEISSCTSAGGAGARASRRARRQAFVRIGGRQLGFARSGQPRPGSVEAGEDAAPPTPIGDTGDIGTDALVVLLR